MGELFGLIMIDVDHFKDINDTLGHDAGDALLKRLAEMLHAAFRRATPWRGWAATSSP
jgi:diguanylate cyclase (GGDEF)-like protein